MTTSPMTREEFDEMYDTSAQPEGERECWWEVFVRLDAMHEQLTRLLDKMEQRERTAA